MKFLLRIGGLGLVGLIALASSVTYAATDVPFRANLTLALTLSSESTFSLSGSGEKIEATHLGKITYIGLGTFTSANTDILIETLTAANGDTLTIRCEQVFEMVGEGLFQGTDTATVIGGTGRFVSATGTLTGETFVDLNTNTVRKSMAGTISY